MRVWGALMFILFSPIAACAALCSEAKPGPCGPSQVEVQKALDALRDVMRARAEILRSEMEWNDARKLHSGKDRDVENELRVFEAYVRAQNEFQTRSDNALAVVQSTYRVRVPYDRGSMQNGILPYPGLEWTNGIPMYWKPHVGLKDDEYREVIGVDGSAHHIHEHNLDDAGHMSLADGRVSISYQQLLEAISERNPGIVAATLYHEAVHFTMAVIGQNSSIEHDEYLAYSLESNHLEDFGITGDGADFITSQRDHFKALDNQGISTPNGQTPTDSAEAAEGYERLRKSEIELSEYYESLKAQVADIRDKRLRKIQEDEQQKRDQEIADSMGEFTGHFLECGFDPDYTADGQGFNGFSSNSHGMITKYRLLHGMNLDQAQVILMFASACLDVTSNKIPPEQVVPCGGGFALANAHWDDPEFRSAIPFSVSPAWKGKCSDYLYKHWKSNTNMRDFARLLAQGAKEARKEADDEARREQRGEGGGDDAPVNEPPERPSPHGEPGYNHPHVPGHCGFSGDGAYCN